MARRRKNGTLQHWFAIVLRNKPNRILAIDRTLYSAKMTVRNYYPDIDPRELAFRTLSQDEFLQIIERATAQEASESQNVDPG